MTQMADHKTIQRLQDEFQSERLLPGLTAGVLMGSPRSSLPYRWAV
jgi:hypothetical protein